MKKKYLVLMLLLTVSMVKATVWTVTVLSSSFSPNSLPNVLCNDTIKWVLGSGSHTTTSTTIPATAATWNAPINSSATAFSYKATVAGTYNYVCTPHGFTGSFTVTCGNGISSLNQTFISTVFPNPFREKISIETPNADVITFYNVVGEKIKSMPLQKGQNKIEIYLADLKDGIYFYNIIKEGVIIETRKIVKN